MRKAVVTGASAGIGREFVLAIDRKGGFDEIWVIARRDERLQELKNVCRTTVRLDRAVWAVKGDVNSEDLWYC